MTIFLLFSLEGEGIVLGVFSSLEITQAEAKKDADKQQESVQWGKTSPIEWQGYDSVGAQMYSINVFLLDVAQKVEL